MPSRQINIITKRMMHHAGHSGYDRLIDYISPDRILTTDGSGFGGRLTAKILKRLIQKSGNKWYQRPGLINELKAAGIWAKNEDQIFHFLYGENSYRYLGKVKKINRRNALVATYHTPPEKFKAVVTSTCHLKQLDAIITVSRMQNEFLADIVGFDKVHYIPHGIDTSYFKPSEDSDDTHSIKECLFVGSHLRDIETLIKAAHIIHSKKSDIKIIAITSTVNKQIIDKAGGIETLTDVSDSELLMHYQHADLLMLPLLEATANNSILEAMACGLPVISSDFEGIRDYVNDQMAILVKPKDSHQLAEAVTELANDSEKLREMSRLSRQQAEKFGWQAVANQMDDLYQTLLP